LGFGIRAASILLLIALAVGCGSKGSPAAPAGPQLPTLAGSWSSFRGSVTASIDGVRWTPQQILAVYAEDSGFGGFLLTTGDAAYDFMLDLPSVRAGVYPVNATTGTRARIRVLSNAVPISFYAGYGNGGDGSITVTKSDATGMSATFSLRVVWPVPAGTIVIGMPTELNVQGEFTLVR
jgi:hypothetical protein